MNVGETTTTTTGGGSKEWHQDAIRELDVAIDQYQVLRRLQMEHSDYQSNGNGKDDLLLGLAELWLCKANVTRVAAQQSLEDDTEAKSSVLYEKAIEYILQATQLFKSNEVLPLHSKESLKGQAEAVKAMGFIELSRGELEKACAEFKYAQKLFGDIGDEEASIADLQHQLDRIAFRLDRVKFINEHHRNKSHVTISEKEREAVHRAFQKFDRDHSGEMNSKEFANLALELGTFPPLRKEEIQEAMQQLDASNDGKISFEELWAWWIADEVQTALGRKKKYHKLTAS